MLSLGDDKSLDDLYQTKILEFARDARKINLLSNKDVRFVLKNPLCGDEVIIDLIINKKKIISHYGHQVKGCALCEASTGLLSKYVIGLNIDDIDFLKDKLISWLNGDTFDLPFNELKNFSPVKNFKNRYKCVTLSFEALSGACSIHKRN